MRIDESTNTAPLRSVSTTDLARSSFDERNRSTVTPDPGSSMSDTSSQTRWHSPTTRSPAPAPTAADGAPTAAALAEQPRFSALIALMERLTGREITLVPPAMIVLGERTRPPGHPSGDHPDATSSTRITGVRPIDQGQAFRVDAAGADDRTGRPVDSFRFDVGLDVIQAHAGSAASRSGALRVHVGAEAVSSPTSAVLRIDDGGANAVRVTATDGRLGGYA